MAALQEMYRRGVHHLAMIARDGVLGLASASDLLFGIATERPGGPTCRVVAC
ncbi:hypothetical protein BJ970_003504 [Saccharopolyspora phatthalungensis]|uniref:CBS domain-containing protein n=1 Tax=Saccharopolyspora phatthalungensis TaxID=664693 RepID=A0A840Q7Y8_9PSEU|nr:hypothetical protein [Saccharopolyspora phatthalungensis]